MKVSTQDSRLHEPTARQINDQVQGTASSMGFLLRAETGVQDVCSHQDGC